MFLNKFLVIPVENCKSLPFLEMYQSTNNLVINIAVNKEVTIPINKVVAKPLMGPEPNIKSMIAVKPVVMFASNIEESALLKPSAIACALPLPLSSSSLIRSKISTLASTDIPMVKTIPAIPGNVSTAPKLVSTPKINTMLKINAISAAIPALP